MKVFVGGKLFDSTRDVIGVVLNETDKANIAAMAPGATIYSEFHRKDRDEAPGVRVFDPECVQKLLERIKQRAGDVGGGGEVGWIDEGIEA